MATWFVRSLATGTGAGTSWTNATTTVNAAITLSTAGDTFFISDDHAESSGANLTITFKGTNTAPDTVLCADHTITSPTSADLKTTAQISTTTTFAIITRGNFYMYGVIFTNGSGATGTTFQINSGTASNQVYEACSFRHGGAGAQVLIISGSGGARTRWVNCTYQVGNAGCTIQTGTIAFFEWLFSPSAILGATLPTNLFAGSTNGEVYMEGVDLSALGSGKTLVPANTVATRATFKECKLGSSVTVSANTFVGLGVRIDAIRCDSGNTNYRNESYSMLGTQTTETTIVRTGGATDGTTGFSHKAVTTTSALKLQPYNLSPISIWNDTTGSAKTITVECIASAVLNNDECWMEVEYMGDASFPTGLMASTYKTNILATGAANTTSTATWGGALTGKFKMAVTITPQQKGPITAYVKVAKVSTTVYIDPMITVT
jgi:hypothetical protein